MKKTICTILITLFAAISIPSESLQAGSELKIYAVKYGKSSFQKRFVFHGDKSGGSVPFSWMFYYIEYGDKKILVDTGFNDSKAVRVFGITDFRDPVTILGENGIKPEDITDIIITHSHFDHIGNVHRFKKARVFINRDELQLLGKDKTLKSINQFLKDNPLVTVFDQSAVLYDLFNIKKIGGHTRGSSVVFFKYGEIEYCFTGDEVYLDDNVTTGTGNGSVSDHDKNMAFINLIKKGDYRLYIFHDNRFADSKERFIRVFP